MKILIMHSRYLSGAVSGENRVVEDEARLLREGGHDVSLWMPQAAGTSGTKLIRTAVGTVWSRPAVRELERRIVEDRPDIVHFHNLFPALSPAVLRTASAHRIPTVMTLHNYRLMCAPGTLMRDGGVCEDCVGHGPWRSVIHRCHRDSFAASAVISTALSAHRALQTWATPTLYLAVSAFLREKHIAAGIPSEQIVVKPNFVWPTTVRSGPGNYFLYLGRLAEEKGVETLLEAWAERAPAPLLVAGDGPRSTALRTAAPDNVVFLGAVPEDRIPALLAGARGLMVPSRWYEGQPRGILEAFAAGVPVVAAAIGGLPELVEDGKNGLLKDPSVPSAWADAASQLLDDDMNERLGLGALRSWHRLFTPARALRSLESSYKEAISIHETEPKKRTRARPEGTFQEDASRT